MIKLYENGYYYINNKELIEDNNDSDKIIKNKTGKSVNIEEGKKGTMAYKILNSHNQGNDKDLKIKFDKITSHDITYVGIIQTARASGMERFPLPYILTNCHNSLGAVGGTINEDDHKFGLSAAKKYGGIYVPPNLAVIHSYIRENEAGVGNMILGSDSHTRYGALGTLAIGEGGGELAKQLLNQTYDIKYPEVVGVYLSGSPKNGVGPQDVALTIIGKVYNNNFAKNKVMEFIGDGISNLPMEFRNSIDVMTTEAASLSSIWETDEKTKKYLEVHNRVDDYKELKPENIAYYDSIIHIDLSKIVPMIAMPFHPSNTYTIEEVQRNPKDIINKVEMGYKKISDGKSQLGLMDKIRDDGLYVDQAIVCGCSGGTFDNIMAVADILRGKSIGNTGLEMSVYPGSQPAYIELIKHNAISDLMNAGVTTRSAFCGPCFGAGDTPANGAFSIRHVTRNFPNREGSKPMDLQMASVGLMDARSIGATALNGGRLTSATELDIEYSKIDYEFNGEVYKNRVYNGVNLPDENAQLIYGPNIKDWPEMDKLPENLLIKIITWINDPVTTTDELIPSGETSSYRSNPLKLAEFTLSRKDPEYVNKAKEVKQIEEERKNGNINNNLKIILDKIRKIESFSNIDIKDIGLGSSIYANKPGDGSAREQAASCQKVLGAWANFAKEYATKRYRSNLINWGILPFLIDEDIKENDYIFIPNIKESIKKKNDIINAYIIRDDNIIDLEIRLGDLTDTEREILISGSLINHNRGGE